MPTRDIQVAKVVVASYISHQTLLFPIYSLHTILPGHGSSSLTLPQVHSRPSPLRSNLHLRVDARLRVHLRARQSRPKSPFRHPADPRRVPPLGHAHPDTRPRGLPRRPPTSYRHPSGPPVRLSDETVPDVPGWAELHPDADGSEKDVWRGADDDDG
jgi:hypothetical protein